MKCFGETGFDTSLVVVRADVVADGEGSEVADAGSVVVVVALALNAKMASRPPNAPKNRKQFITTRIQNLNGETFVVIGSVDVSAIQKSMLMVMISACCQPINRHGSAHRCLVEH